MAATSALNTRFKDPLFQFGRVSLPDPARLRPQKIRDYFLWFEPKRSYLLWPGEIAAVVEEGRRVRLQVRSGASEAIVRLCVGGPIMSVLLEQKGFLMLHASAVEVDGTAVVFLGKGGSGKSTLAAAFAKRGCPLITDNALAVRAGGTAEAPSGAPLVKLRKDSATFVGMDFETLSTIEPGSDKRFAQVEKSVSCVIPVGCLYVLTDAPRAEIAPLDFRAAVSELIQHSLGGRVHAEGKIFAEHFQKCARLARAVPVRRLGRPFGFSHIDEIIRVIQRDVVNVNWL